VAAARDAGALVLLDAKRGDIGSTMQGYADAYLDQTSPMAVDAVTVSPYLGFESLRPMLDTAAANAAGVFVLGLTSNPEGSQVQHARNGDVLVAQEILDAVAKENSGQVPMGSVGAVVGANLASLAADVAVNGPILAPGFGAQGGTVDNLRALFADVLDLLLPTTSRDVLKHGPHVAGLQEAVRRASEDVSALRDAV
jgi:orotidine-5'-phosphate decarboxylase